jgi:chlorite dismutase/DNA-binding Lrp family transcriptional regulator/nitrite reductase/ring-hydroxylating ferredoxin subunit
MERTHRRQFVKFAFFQVDPAWRALPADERERAKQAFEEVVSHWAERIVVRPYTLVGVRGDCDMLLWLVSEQLEDLQNVQTQLLRTPFGPYLRNPYSYLAMTKRSIYVDRYATEEEAKRRDIIVPGNGKYLFVYPFVKTRAWYALPEAERQRMMDDHIKTGRKYPDVKLNTTYSFGLDDQEFVVAFETDDPSRFLDLVQELRESEASSYTLRDTPTFTCIATTVRGMLDSLGGATVSTPEPVAEQQQPAAQIAADGFVEVCKVADVPVNGAKLVVVEGEQIALFNTAGAWYALENRCSHARGPLVDGEVADGKVTCPWHSAEFDLRSGAALCKPARGPVKAFAVRIDGDVVLVGPRQVEDPAAANGAAPAGLPASDDDGLDAVDKKLLNLLQWEFPVRDRPWQALGEKLGQGEQEIMARVQRLRDRGIVRQISAIFDTRRLGYTSSLVAVRVDPARIDEAAAVVNRHPGVSHNYQRDHYFNMWFTIAVPPGADLEGELQRLTEAAGVEKVRVLPTLKLYKIGVRLDMEKDETKLGKDTTAYAKTREALPLTERDKDLIRAVQDDMPLVPEPFAAMAATAGIETVELFAWLEEMQAMGYLRRVAAILRHQKAGFTDNGMVTWKSPEEVVDQAGKIAASYPQVSHCYRRPVYEDWPYNLFSMIHARSRENCEEIAREMARELAPLGISEYAVLYSTKEFKKDRVRYFVDWDLEGISTEASASAGD